MTRRSMWLGRQIGKFTQFVNSLLDSRHSTASGGSPDSTGCGRSGRRSRGSASGGTAASFGGQYQRGAPARRQGRTDASAAAAYPAAARIGWRGHRRRPTRGLKLWCRLLSTDAHLDSRDASAIRILESEASEITPAPTLPLS